MTIRSVAVLGAGTMGAQIAAHFANAGIPVLLLDVSREAAARGLQRAKSLAPDPFFLPDTWQLVTTGSFDADLAKIADADWVIEAIVEVLDAKRALLARVDRARRRASWVTSNTSGLSIAALAEGRSDDFRRHWLGTHFFNPPRYLHLLEIVPTADTEGQVVEAVRSFADRRLGKGVVLAKDSPGFIGNRLGTFGLLRVLETVTSGQYTIEEVDAITGPILGRPKSATFRTLDLAGLDIVAHVVSNLRRRLAEPERDAFVLPPLIERMIEKGLTGEKAGAGFYTRVTRADGESEILVLDPESLDYRPRQPSSFASIEAARTVGDVRLRVRSLYEGTDRVAAFLRLTLEPTLRYASRIAPHVASSPDDVDRVMRWGFGWELGPFELADALGIDAPSRGRQGTRSSAAPDVQILRSARERSRVVARNPTASLIDLGDGVACVEFHSKMNTITADTLRLLAASVRNAAASFSALVIGNEAEHFTAGADLALVLAAAQQAHWREIERGVRSFQDVGLAIRYADVPVVVAPAGLALGGGCEMALHADRVQAAAETYIGLSETGVGLIPAGGGTKEMTARAAATMTTGDTDLLPAMQRAFETVAFARVSTSAPDARRLGYLRAVDGITMNRERLIADAKAVALARVREGYQPPVPRTAIPVGGDTVLAPLKLGIHLAWRAGRISDHDALIGRTLAAIMAGGAVPHATTVSEQHLLDLEREAFLSLLGQPQTQARIQHTLRTGKPLRN